MFYHLTGSHMHNMYLFLRNTPSSWRNAHEGSTMSTTKGIAHHHLLAVSKYIFDGELSIREGAAVESHELFKGCRAGRGTRSGMVLEIGRDQFICGRKVALIKQLFPG